MITYKLNLSMDPGGISPVIHVGQYDDDYTLVFKPFSAAGVFSIESGSTAEIRGTKLDGNGYSADAEIEDGLITVAGDKQMTAVAGMNVFEIVIKSGDKVLSSTNFCLAVEHAAMDAETVESESVINEISSAVTDWLDEHGIETMTLGIDEEDGLLYLYYNGVKQGEGIEIGGEIIPPVMYSVTNQLTNVSSSNSATTVRENRAYTAILSLAQDATLDSVVVKMGGTDITSSAWNAETMTISIASVTGDITITAVASIVITVPVTWTGTGTDSYCGTIDTTQGDLYYTIPFVEGDDALSDGVTAASNAIKGRDTDLYSDAGATELVGYYRIDTGEIASTKRTGTQSPSLLFDTEYKIAPSGYYAKPQVTKIATYKDNASSRTYLNRNATTMKIVSTPEPEPEPETVTNAARTDADLLMDFKSVPLHTNLYGG